MNNTDITPNDGDHGMDAGQRLSQDWWRTSIIDMRPGEIRYRGYPIEQLIGRVSFAQMIWLMLRGELPSASRRTKEEWVFRNLCDDGELAWRTLPSSPPTTILLLVEKRGRARQPRCRLRELTRPR